MMLGSRNISTLEHIRPIVDDLCFYTRPVLSMGIILLIDFCFDMS